MESIFFNLKKYRTIATRYVPRPGEQTAFIAELFDLVDWDIECVGYHVCPSPETEIFDLNIQRLPIAKLLRHYSQFRDAIHQFTTAFTILRSFSIHAARSFGRPASGNQGANLLPSNGPMIVSRKAASPASGMIVCQTGCRRRTIRAPGQRLSADSPAASMRSPSSEKCMRRTG
jgi:hypothetical protein